MPLNSGIQTYQILANDYEVCLPSPSSIFLAVTNKTMTSMQWMNAKVQKHN